MSEERCERSDLLASQCAHCRGDVLESEPDFVVVARFPAKYAGVCAACGEPFEVEDRIGRTDDGDYVCEVCAGG